MTDVTLDTVLAAEAKLKEILIPTPLQYNERLSKQYDADVYLKREDLQPVRSYKIRGAYNAIINLSPEQRKRGVVCASAGNHAQGVAWACTHLKVRATIFMPSKTPLQKVNRVRYFGGDMTHIILEGNTYDEAAEAASTFANKYNAYFVHPFSDPFTIAGQATVTAEIFAQSPKVPDALLVPVGGGGLLAGATIVTKAKNPATQIYGVEPAGAASMAAAAKAGEPITLSELDTFVDGCAVRTVGEQSFNIINRHPVNFQAIDNGLLCKIMVDLYQNEGIVTEPSGALSIAALESIRQKVRGIVVCIVSGGNNDLTRYPEIIERSLIYQGLKHYFLVQFSQRPGQLRNFLDNALGPNDDIVRFEYTKKNNKESGPALVGIELAEKSDLERLLKRITNLGITFKEVTGDQLLFDFLV